MGQNTSEVFCPIAIAVCADGKGSEMVAGTQTERGNVTTRKALLMRMMACVCVTVALLCLFVSPAFAEVSDSSASSSASASSAVAQTAISNTSAEADGEPVVADDPFEDAIPVDLDDGIYLISVTLEGGTGKASISTPAEFEVFDGVGALTAEWSSPYYDYMLVNGKKYLPVNDSGNSVFIIPVMAYDEPFDAIGDTTAMSEAHEIDYKITVSLDSVQKYDTEKMGTDTPTSPDPGWVVFIACMVLAAAALIATIALLLRYHKRR